MKENAKNEWIPVEKCLPEPEKEVMIQAVTSRGAVTITSAIYENGKINEEDSVWMWVDVDLDYDEDTDSNYIPEGWWEYRHYNPDDVYENVVDDKVVAWIPMPEPYKPPESKTSWCGICDYAAGGCPGDGNWRHCEKNFQIEREQEN